MDIQQIRNATVKIACAGCVFLVDPWLQDKGTGFSANTVRPEMQGVKSPLDDLPDSPGNILSDVDFCLVTHVHPDHITKDYIPDEMPMIAQNAADAEKLNCMGFKRVRWFADEPMTIGNVRITRVDGIHGDTPEVVQRMGVVSGYIVQAEGEKTLYIAGDTVWYDGVRDTIREYHPDVIIVNCAAATMPIGRLIMNLEDLQMVYEEAADALIIASHLDSVNHATVTRDDVKKWASEKGASRVLVPENGYVMTVE
jgi:L-ascorbate metabolism protein UlaG (beta-lactamase superfamily)